MRFTVENRFPLSPDEVVELLLDAELQEDVFEELGYEHWRERERREEETGELVRILEVRPRMELPGFIRTAVGEGAGYRERQVWAPDRRSYSWRVELEVSSRVRLEGSCVFEPAGEHECVRRIDGRCRVDVPLLGGRIAAYVRDQTVRSQTEAAEALIGRLEFEEPEEDA